MPAITFDRFDGGLLLARPSSTAPANSLSRALNFDPQPGGWMRSRPAWKRTEKSTQISSNYKGLESNAGRLWVFGSGNSSLAEDANTVLPINSTTSLCKAFRATGIAGETPANSTLLGVSKWNNGFVAVSGYVTSGVVGATYKTLYSLNTSGAIVATPITDANMPSSGLMVTATSRVFAISDDGQAVRYSCVGSATAWTDSVGNIGSGFIPISQHFGSGQRAYAIGLYQGKLAVFTESSIQIWTIDADPSAIALSNVVESVGTRHHQSIVSLQGDLLFLSSSGIRSLTTLQNSLYPTDTDVGLPVKAITSSPEGTSRTARFGRAVSCISVAATPFAQYWIACPDNWLVDPTDYKSSGYVAWSYSRQAKLNAWSAHQALKKISAWTALSESMFCRNDGDDYLMQLRPDVYGSEQIGAEISQYSAQIDTQWLDFKKPGVRKVITGVDFDGCNIASIKIYSSLGGNRGGVLMDTIAIGISQDGWTYSGDIFPVQADGTEFKLCITGEEGLDAQINRLTLYFDEAGLA